MPKNNTHEGEHQPMGHRHHRPKDDQYDIYAICKPELCS